MNTAFIKLQKFDLLLLLACTGCGANSAGEREATRLFVISAR
jgi:hypothetical protein